METPLPRIVRFTGTSEGASCPHCGAEGKHIVWFQLENGQRHGAMRGCVQLFPVAPIAVEEMRLREKLNNYIKLYGETAHLNVNDSKALDAIEGFYSGTVSEGQAVSLVKSAKRINQAKYRR